MIRRIISIILIVLLIIFLVFSRIRITGDKFFIEDQDLYVKQAGKKAVIAVENVVDFKLVNLFDSTENLLVIEADKKNQTVDNILYGNWIKFYDIDTSNGEVIITLIYENDFTRVKPWAIDAGDLDDDNRKDIYVGAYRATDFYEADKRPFFFNWDGEILSKKWTGSYLSLNRLKEVSFEDINNDSTDELKVLEVLPNGESVYHYYCWGYFGFTRVE